MSFCVFLVYTGPHICIREKLCFAQTIYYLRHNYIIVSTDAPFYQIWLFLCTFCCFYLIFILHFTHIFIHLYTSHKKKKDIFIKFTAFSSLGWYPMKILHGLNGSRCEKYGWSESALILVHTDIRRTRSIHMENACAWDLCVFSKEVFAHKHTHAKIWKNTYMCKVNTDRVHLQSLNVWGCLC